MTTLPYSVRIATVTDLPLLSHLWQFFRHDLSEFRDELPRADGTFRDERLISSVTDIAWAVYLLESSGRPVGLAVIRGLDQPVRVLSGFFVVRGARRGGIGLAAVSEILIAHPGAWEVAFQANNAVAASFWRRVAEASGADWSEELRYVPGRPELPPDSWISFDTFGWEPRGADLRRPRPSPAGGAGRSNHHDGGS